MITRSVTRAVVSLCLLGLSTGMLTGCGASTPQASASSAGIQIPGAKTTVVLDAAIAKQQRGQIPVAPDPFGNSGLVVRSDKAHHDEQKICFVSGEGLFVVPADPAGQSVVFRLAAQGPLGVRIVFSTKNGSVSYPVTLAAEEKWFDVAVPLPAIADRLGKGEKVLDITLFQLDLTKHGTLYLHSAVLAVKPAP